MFQTESSVRLPGADGLLLRFVGGDGSPVRAIDRVRTR